MLTKLESQLVELFVRLCPLLFALLGTLLVAALGCHHDHTGGSLCAASSAQLSPAGQVDVGDVVVLAENRNVRDDVDGRNIGSQDDNAGWEGVGERWVTCRGLADCFYDFLDAALEALLLGR